MMSDVRRRCLRGESRGRVQGVRTPPPTSEMTCGFLIRLEFCKKKKRNMWFIGVEVEQETSAPPPKKNPGSAPVSCRFLANSVIFQSKIPLLLETS